MLYNNRVFKDVFREKMTEVIYIINKIRKKILKLKEIHQSLILKIFFLKIQKKTKKKKKKKIN